MLMAASAWAQEPAAKPALTGNAGAGEKIAQSGSAGGAAACISCLRRRASALRSLAVIVIRNAAIPRSVQALPMLRAQCAIGMQQQHRHAQVFLDLGQ